MGILKEFKSFALQGNVMDLAVGIIIGAAIGKMVSALVDNILMPLIGILLMGQNFAGLSVKVGDAELKYGLFIQHAVDFLIIAFVLFLLIKGINRFRTREKVVPAPAEPSTTEKLLMEIRDTLKKQ